MQVIVMATVANALVTLAEYARMTSDTPTELVRGEVIDVPPPASRHGMICATVIELLCEWSPRQSKGVIISNDAGFVVARDPDTVRGPDVMFLAKQRVPAAGFAGNWVEVPPDLIAEIRSPSNGWADVVDKVGQYLKAGVREVWVLNPPRKTVHIYRPEPDAEPAILDASAELTTDVLPGFRCTVGEFFAGL